jgi:flagellar biosynthesis protein FlhA
VSTAASAPSKTSIADMTPALAVVGVLALAVIPLPPLAIDLLLGGALCASVLVFLLSIYVERPLDFAAFPSLLLLLTLFRLALNVATTRIVLLHGANGPHAAGQVIAAFGEFAVGGNFVVGAVVFMILVIVNFVVITKGAERISEVSARFTLDSLPGKQMAIDADLGAGLITEKDARERRKEVAEEAEFHGSMDGASKFVRGDAVAGLMIVAINIVGGIIVGLAQHGLSIGEAARTYTLLSIGDGLVTQIPALLVSTGAALLATRSSAANGGFGRALGLQLFSRQKPLMVAAGVVGIMGMVPGMPHVAFLAAAGALGFAASRAPRVAAAAAKQNAEAKAQGDVKTSAGEPKAANAKADLEQLLPLDLLTLEVGLDVLPLVDASRNGELLGRIASLRKQMAQDLGFIVPPVHVRDDLRLRPGAYRLLISGAKVAQGEVRVGRLLAIDPGDRAANLPGETVKEPTFGLPAKWIVASDRTRAEAAGCTVVDPSAVIATHITEIVRRHAHELLGRREAQELVDIAAKQNSKVVEELIPHLMTLGDVIKVLRNLLAESVSIRDARSIFEALADNAAAIKDPAELTEMVRQRLSRTVTAAHLSDEGELRAMVLDPRAEEIFRTGMRGGDASALSRLVRAIEEAAHTAAQRDESPVLLCAPDVRRAVSQIALRHVPGLAVLSHREVDPSVPLVTRGIVSAPAK